MEVERPAGTGGGDPRGSGMGRVEAITGGLCLIIFFAMTEWLPFAKTINGMSRHATAHLLVLLLPRSALSGSPLWFLIPAAAALAGAVLPFRHRGIRIFPALLILSVAVFFALAETIPDPTSVGPLWLTFVLPWVGAVWWAWDLDYLMATVVAAVLWDLGAGAQALYYGTRAVPEPYGNSIPSAIVVSIDSSAALIVTTLWLVSALRSSGYLGRARNEIKRRMDRLETRAGTGVPGSGQRSDAASAAGGCDEADGGGEGAGTRAGAGAADMGEQPSG